MSRIREAKKRMEKRGREIRSKFEDVVFCPACGSVLVYLQKVEGCMQKPGWFCRKCKAPVQAPKRK